MHWFEYLEINCLHCLFQTTREKHVYNVRVGPLSLCSQALPLPLGVPPMPALACFDNSLSQDSEVQRVYTRTDVGNVGVRVAKLVEPVRFENPL